MVRQELKEDPKAADKTIKQPAIFNDENNFSRFRYRILEIELKSLSMTFH